MDEEVPSWRYCIAILMPTFEVGSVRLDHNSSLLNSGPIRTMRRGLLSRRLPKPRIHRRDFSHSKYGLNLSTGLELGYDTSFSMNGIHATITAAVDENPLKT